MSAIACCIRPPVSGGHLLVLVLALLGSAWVLAGDGARLEVSPVYGDLLSDEIYRQVDGWREPPMFDSEWRAPPPQHKGRIRYGYDSAYEELRAREEARSSMPDRDFREPKPSTLVRFGF